MRIIKRGSNYFINCIFHKEKTASCKIDFVKGEFYCFGCGAKGSIDKIFGHKDLNYDIVELKKEKLLAEISKQLVTVDSEWKSVDKPFRNIDVSIYNYFKVTYSEDVLKFPLYKHKKVIGHYYYYMNNSSKKFELYKKSTLYPQYEKNIKFNSYLIITEGIFDMLKTYSLGYKQVLALVNLSCYRFLPNIIKDYNITKLYIMLDSDDAGKTTTNKLIQILEDVDYTVINLPVKDPAQCKSLKNILQKYIKD